MPKVICDACGKEYEKPPYHIKRSKHHYCSPECMSGAFSTSLLVKCEACGKEIYKPPSEIKNHKHYFCSNKCRGTLYKSEEQRQKKRARWADPEFKKKMSAVRIKQFANPETRQKMRDSHKGKTQSKESREKRRLLMRDRYFSEEHRHKISVAKKGPLNAMWKGGFYPKKYCFRFNKALKDSIREEHGYKCFLCPTKQHFPGLSIHHIDYNHNAGCNNMRFALLPLCCKCHTKTNHNRWYWFNLLISYWLLNPEISLTPYPFSPI